MTSSVFPRLGVNIDHVATLRQARGESYPSVVDAAKLALEYGADQITIHLREDRRHIQDTDVEAVRLVTQKFNRPLNLEMGSDPGILDVAIASAPDWICLVPENRQERTTEGGLNLKDHQQFDRIQHCCEKLRHQLPQVKISLFIESDLEVLKLAKTLNADAVEIHTGEYARAMLYGEDTGQFLQQYQATAQWLAKHQIHCHAGHGLTYQSVAPLLAQQLFEEYNIGHWIICQAVFDGLGNVISDLRKLFDRYPL